MSTLVRFCLGRPANSCNGCNIPAGITDRGAAAVFRSWRRPIEGESDVQDNTLRLPRPRATACTQSCRFAPGSETARAPGGHTASQQLRRQYRFPGKHGETVQFVLSGQFPDHRRESGGRVADVVDGGGETAVLASQRSRTYSAFPRGEEEVRGESAHQQRRMRFCETREVACEALHQSRAEAHWPEMVEAGTRWHLCFFQGPGFVLSDFTHWHTRLHD